jgi:hypothetical protein
MYGKNTRRPVPWERALGMSGTPLVPPLGEALGRVLSPQKITEFTIHLKPLVESGIGQERRALAYLTAVKQQAASPNAGNESLGAAFPGPDMDRGKRQHIASDAMPLSSSCSR